MNDSLLTACGFTTIRINYESLFYNTEVINILSISSLNNN